MMQTIFPWLRRGTTPTFQVDLGLSLSLFKTVHLSFAQNGEVLILKEMADFEVDEDNNTFFKVTLSQDDTLSLKKGVCTAQVRAVFKNGVTADATDMLQIYVLDVQEGGVLE